MLLDYIVALNTDSVYGNGRVAVMFEGKWTANECA